MKAIIPVAGLGTRLRPHTYTTPKVLLPVAGKPMLAHILDELISLGIDEVTFIVHHFGDDIKSWICKHYSFKSNFVHQPELRGLGHAIHLAKEYHKNDDSVLIILGDTIFYADLAQAIQWKENSIGVKSVDDPRRFGIVELKGDKVVRLIEKPEHSPTNLAIVGIYHIVEPGVLFDALEEVIQKGITTKGEIQLTDALQIMLNKGSSFRAFEIEEWLDCGKPETLLDTNRRMLTKLFSEKEHARLMKIHESAILVPPVSILENAQIINSVIGPYVTVCEDARIENSVIKNAIIDKNARIRNILLDESLIGESADVNGKSYRLNVGDNTEMDIG
ncbi:NTP transferase domain-containing protein [Candidatus Sumerlaeota bacterium]|nr:NTP transferase domain-containing protein [Candidatus Sumerlaeota bacterium]